MEMAVFSLNLSSAGKGPFMGSKAKHNYAPEAHFSGGGRGGRGGIVERNMVQPSLGNLGA